MRVCAEMLAEMAHSNGGSRDTGERPAPSLTAGLPGRMRAARRAAGLSLDGAAQAIGVSRSSIQRWELPEGSKDSLTPRDHWPEVERVYGVSRLELEYGISPDVAAFGEPTYPAWPEFLVWVDAVQEALGIEQWHIENLRRMRVPEGDEMTLEDYRHALNYMLARPKRTK